MSQLILTDEERRSPLMTWGDASLGRAVKAAAALLCEKDDPPTMPGVRNLNITACAVTLIGEAIAANAEESTVTIRGATKAGKELGDWEITIKQLAPETV